MAKYEPTQLQKCRFGSVRILTPRKLFPLPIELTSVGKICTAYGPLDVGCSSTSVW
jgi:hypothetical protein